MFEDFKDKIREQSKAKQEAEDASLSPEVLEKLKQQGIDPENFTLEQLFPECLDETRHKPRPIGGKTIRKAVHQLYVQAGLLKKSNGRMYDLRVHSLRKFFKTQLLALGVQSDYVDYMMGHTVDTYHDIQSIGIDRLRNVTHHQDSA